MVAAPTRSRSMTGRLAGIVRTDTLPSSLAGSVMTLAGTRARGKGLATNMVLTSNLTLGGMSALGTSTSTRSAELGCRSRLTAKAANRPQATATISKRNVFGLIVHLPSRKVIAWADPRQGLPGSLRRAQRRRYRVTHLSTPVVCVAARRPVTGTDRISPHETGVRQARVN